MTPIGKEKLKKYIRDIGEECSLQSLYEKRDIVAGSDIETRAKEFIMKAIGIRENELLSPGETADGSNGGLVVCSEFREGEAS